MAILQAAVQSYTDYSSDVHELLQFWVPGCGLDGGGLDEDECPNCFGGNIGTIFSESGAQLQCTGCGATGAVFAPTTGR
ncbi:hypothetical protein HGA34_04550 [Candidatus Falkowbacteria bacterium]|nr:hypothetical protein [Candidatus Falkowbacteria bacterium]